MSKQLITIRPDGSMFGLDHKRKGLQLRELGKAKTDRVTLIEWNEDLQAWFIKWTQTPNIGNPWTENTFHKAGVFYSDYNGCASWGGIIHFHDYEDANAAEVAVIQALTLLGRFPEPRGYEETPKPYDA